MRTIWIGLVVVLSALGGCMGDGDDDDDAPTSPQTSSTSTSGTQSAVNAMAELHKLTKTGTEGGVVGWVNFTELAGQLTIHVTIQRATGLNATAHGAHIHTTGDCGGDGTTAGSKAGGHFNPDNATHGSHAGDLGNVTTDAGGNGTRTILPAELEAPLTLSAGKYQVLGRSFVLHANPDDGHTNPAGNSGPRVLCGVINVA
jgi:superoxide dismutase, Cu-Zn family